MLKTNDLHAYYGKSHIIQGISFSVGEGEIVSLLGRNGVGRSTTIKAIMGEVEHTGSINFKGEEISQLPTHEIARRGLGYVPENRDIFPTMTTLQNLHLGMKKKGKTGRWTVEDMYNMFPNLRARSHVLAGMISGGEQQMLTICRTLMGDVPDVHRDRMSGRQRALPPGVVGLPPLASDLLFVLAHFLQTSFKRETDPQLPIVHPVHCRSLSRGSY